MSYILDALRKADAQRQRTRLPGLHAQAPAVAANASSSAWWRSPVAWVLGSALVVLAVVLAWPSSQQPVPVPTTAATQDPAPAPSPAAPPVHVAAAPTSVADATPPAATTIQPAPPPAIPERRSSPRAMRSTPDRVAPPAREASTPAPAAPATAASSPAAAAPAAVAPAAESSSAPPGAPKLAITGGVYSSNAAQRLLIVGGQVFNEGSEIAPGVVLEQVRPNQALLNYRGQRYTVRY